MAARIAERYRMLWSEMCVEHWAGGATPPLLLVHDRGDRIVPSDHAERIRRAWREAELLMTSGLGHRGVRRNGTVIKRAVAFLRS
jgi:pimeloyl-ACP methyl ester carboxylesterase